jgi:type VI secretion system protein ImpF
MDELKIRKGAIAPLFERLVDLDPASREEARALRILGRQGLLASIRRELTWLLDTRHTPRSAPGAGPRTVIDYGIPDLVSSAAALREEDAKALCEQIRAAVLAFEPRLARPQVDLVTRGLTLVVRIAGELVTETVTEPVSFALELERGAREESAGE